MSAALASVLPVSTACTEAIGPSTRLRARRVRGSHCAPSWATSSTWTTCRASTSSGTLGCSGRCASSSSLSGASAA